MKWILHATKSYVLIQLHGGVLRKQVFLKILSNSQENASARVTFFNEVVGFRSTTLLKKRLWHNFWSDCNRYNHCSLTIIAHSHNRWHNQKFSGFAVIHVLSNHLPPCWKINTVFLITAPFRPMDPDGCTLLDARKSNCKLRLWSLPLKWNNAKF